MSARAEFRPDRLLPRLVARGVDFVVIGGMAMVLHGSARGTHDLDICYASDGTNLDLLGAALVELEARLHGIDEDVPCQPDGRTLRRTTLVTLETPEGRLDLTFQPLGAPPFEELRRRAIRMDLGGYAVLVASLDDLAAMKRADGRPIDLIDLEEIEVIRRLGGGGG